MENSFTDWLKANEDPDNMLPPSMKAEEAILFLKNYLLGKNWYVSYPGSEGQIITDIVYDILKKYSKKFKKELKALEKAEKKNERVQR